MGIIIDVIADVVTAGIVTVGVVNTRYGCRRYTDQGGKLLRGFILMRPYVVLREIRYRDA
jgi:hypothetical protein